MERSESRRTGMREVELQAVVARLIGRRLSTEIQSCRREQLERENEGKKGLQKGQTSTKKE